MFKNYEMYGHLCTFWSLFDKKNLVNPLAIYAFIIAIYAFISYITISNFNLVTLKLL